MTGFDQLINELNRFSVGYEPTFSMFEHAKQFSAGYPPYNIEKIGNDNYRISMAIAGFKATDINIMFDNGRLMISGSIADTQDKEYVYKGIATREFYKEFKVQDHVKVTGSNLSDGILAIDLYREIPDSMKPRKIEISTSSASPLIENKK